MGTLRYRLDDPRLTLYHRVALGGLAATVRAWGASPPAGITASCSANEVTLAWGDDLTDRVALQRILEASFRIEDGLIDLPGHFIAKDRLDLRVAVHNAVCSTFLQHNTSRSSDGVRTVQIRDGDVLLGTVSHQVLLWYAHQSAQGSHLLDGPIPKGAAPGSFPSRATITQSMVPGASRGRRELEATAEDAILLHYLVVGSSIFGLRSRDLGDLTKTCVVFPEVRNLLEFTDAIEAMNSGGVGDRRRAGGDIVGRLVGGVAEAGLRCLLDLNAVRPDRPTIYAVQAVAMGSVPWDKNQQNRSFHVRMRHDHAEIELYRVAQEQIGRAKVIPVRDGGMFLVPCSPVPELIAANLGAEQHWCNGFRQLVQTAKDFKAILYTRKELNLMTEVIQDPRDKALIDAFHEAWSRRQGRLGERAREEKADFGRLVTVERERLRNGILRAKTVDALSGWFLRFCADATHGAALPALREHSISLQEILFQSRNSARLQNLLLFALVSYSSRSETDAAAPSADASNSTTNPTQDPEVQA